MAISAICLIIIVLLCFTLQSRKIITEPYAYQNLLTEYERVMEDTSYVEEAWSNNIYDRVKMYVGKTPLYYCIKDLNGDGKPELILSVFEKGYTPFVIYTYDEDGVYQCCISERYIMTIYKGGIVELISGGVCQHFMYEQIEKNEVFEKTLDIIVCEQIDDEEPHYYEYEAESEEYKDITEEEFYDIRNQYTAVREELEWKPVEGFWDAEKAEHKECILADDSVIDLGNHMIAYRTSSDMITTDHKGEYIAIHNLTDNKILYLPDIYDEVYEIAIEANESIFISYGDMGNSNIQEVHIPVQFPIQTNTVYEVDTMEEKILTEVRGNTSNGVEILPKLIWNESAVCGDRTYEITFERTSHAYRRLISEADGLFADYRITVKDEEENLVTEQILINYPIEYEEVYWLTDFSGDGFPDIAFCTEYDPQEKNLTTLHFMIWNKKSRTYELKLLPLPGLRIVMPLWNENNSSIIYFFTAFEEWKICSYHNGEWTERSLKEDEEGEDGNPENVALYPDAECWERKVVTVDGETISKYVKRKSQNERILKQGERTFAE